MVDLKHYYDSRVDSLSPHEHLKQVGHTVGGQVISEADFTAMINDIVEILDLSREDVLLELCCGNGVITKKLSDYVHNIFAIDASKNLIDVALSHNYHESIVYCTGDIFQLQEILTTSERYTKVLMFAALQHFKKEQLSEIIDLIRPFCRPNFKLLLGFVPDVDRRWNFFDTFAKRKKYFLRCLTGQDVMGTWWQKKFIRQVCQEMSLQCEFIDIRDGRYGEKYRFHVLISPVIKI